MALLKVLCARHFGIAPGYADAGPDLPAMLAVADAALLIGEPALLAGTRRSASARSIWRVLDRRMTGLPFVCAFWAGRLAW